MGRAATRTAEVARLRTDLEARFGSVVLPAAGTSGRRTDTAVDFRTGLYPIDRLLPRGVPRGGLSVWAGEMGRTAALRALVGRACAGGDPVGLVDAGLTLDPAGWCGEDDWWLNRLWVARPPSPVAEAEAAWAAEVLLQSGGFALVVLDGALPGREQAYRLRSLARERGAALLISVARAATVYGADSRLDFEPAATAGQSLTPGGRFRRLASVRRSQSGGVPASSAELELVHEPSDRLRAGPVVADRSARSR